MTTNTFEELERLRAESDDDHIMRRRGHLAESIDVRNSLMVSVRGERTVPGVVTV